MLRCVVCVGCKLFFIFLAFKKLEKEKNKNVLAMAVEFNAVTVVKQCCFSVFFL